MRNRIVLTNDSAKSLHTTVITGNPVLDVNVVQTVSGGGSSGDVNLATIAGTVTSVNSGAADNGTIRVVLSTGSAVSSTQSGTWNIGTLTTITNPVTVAQATAANLNATIVGTGTFAAQVTGAVTANAGTNLNTSLLALDTSVNGLLLAQASTTSGQSGPLAQTATTTNAPSYTTAKTNPLSTDTSGLLRVSLKDTPANTNKFLVTADAVTFAAPQHVIVDSGTITAVTSITNAVTVAQATAANLNATVVGTVTATIAAGPTTIAKAEDVASADADVGVPAMAIQKATPANTAGTDGDYAMLQMSAGRLWVDPSGVTLTVASHAVTNAGTFAVQAAITAASGSISAGAIAAGATSFVKLEDVASADADAGVACLAVRKAAPANTSGTDGDYEFLQISAGRLWASATIDAALPAGANVIGHVIADSGSTTTVTGNVTVVQGTSTNLKADITIAAAQTLATVTTVSTVTNLAQLGGAAISMNTGVRDAGTQRVTIATDDSVPVTGTVTANAGTNLNTSALATNANLVKLLIGAGSSTASQSGPAIMGAVTTAAPSYSTSQVNWLSLTTAGALRIDGSGVTQPVSGTVTANIGTSGSLALDASVTGLQVAQASTTSGQKGGLTLAAVNNANPSYSDGQTSPLSLTTAGLLRVSATLAANQSVNIAQINGVTTLVGNGVTGTGSQRVTIASDNTAFSVNAIQSGSWSVTATPPTDVAPATQNITAQDTASTVTSGFNSQSIITGSATANSTAAFSISTEETIRMQVSGTWTGTLQTEISMDGGTTWYINGGHQSGTVFNSSSVTANAEISINVAGATNFRVRATAAVTGTATIKIIESMNTNFVFVSGPIKIVDGSGGTSNQVNVTASNALKVDGSAVTQPVSISGNQAVNVAQINGVTPLMGNGVTGTGSQRVTIASDNTAFSVNAVQSGTWFQFPGATSSSTSTTSRAVSTALETSRVIKASAGNLYKLTGINNKATAQYIQIFNSTTVPADTTVPIYVFFVAPGNFSFDCGSFPVPFSTGISVSNSSTLATKTIGSADCWFTAEYV